MEVGKTAHTVWLAAGRRFQREGENSLMKGRTSKKSSGQSKVTATRPHHSFAARWAHRRLRRGGRPIGFGDVGMNHPPFTVLLF